MGRQLKYDQVKLAVLNVITQDRLKPGDRLPSVRRLLTRIPCSMITLRKSLEMLEAEGMLIRCIGKGTFLKRTVTPTSRNGKVLFINVDRKNELSYPPAGSREYLQSYFNKYGLDFQYLQVESFSDEILNALPDVLGIMLYGWLSEDFLRSLKALQIPLLTVGNSRRFPGIPQVELNFRRGAEMVAEHIIRQGAKSIFLLNSDSEYFAHDDIREGVRKAVRKHAGIHFAEADLFGRQQPEKVYELIKKYGRYDAWIFESGNYFTYLGTCRYYSLKQQPLIGIAGSMECLEHPLRYLVIGASHTVASVFHQSFFEKAAEMLKERIVNNIEMKSVRLEPEILGDGFSRGSMEENGNIRRV